MDDREERDDQAELISRMFALLTARLEDGAAIAVEGQARGLPAEQIREASSRLIGLGEEVVTIARAIEAIAQRCSAD